MRIGMCRLLNIKVVRDGETLYEGMVDDAPDDIKNLEYKAIESGSPIVFQV